MLVGLAARTARSAGARRRERVVASGWPGRLENLAETRPAGDQDQARGNDWICEGQAQSSGLPDFGVALVHGVAGGAAESELHDNGFDFSVLLPVADHLIESWWVAAVLGRDLYEFLRSSCRFTDWFDEQVVRCGLRSGIDYQEVFKKKLKNPQGGRPRKEFAFTLHAVK